MNPLTHLNKYDIILGSGSPRRQDLLSLLDLKFSIQVSGADELIPEGMPSANVPAYLSKLKSDDIVSNLRGNYLLITADTVVILDNELMGKPKDSSDAKKMIKKLSGHTHQVITGVTVRSTSKEVTFSETTLVDIEVMNDNEISWYIDHYQTLDKAGAYGIQDWLGLSKISRLEGTYYNVMGLPTNKLYGVLKEWKS